MKQKRDTGRSYDVIYHDMKIKLFQIMKKYANLMKIGKCEK